MARARRGWVLNGDRDAAVLLPRGVVPWSAVYRRWSSPRGSMALRTLDTDGLEGLLVEVRDALAPLGEADPQLQRDLAAFRSALSRVSVEEAFVPAIAPAMVGRGQNRYYATDEEYVFAIAEALRTEYRAIVDAGFILQIDDPGLGETWDMLIPPPPLEEYRRMQSRNIDALNHALSAIPEDRVRYHLCWGSWQGPHVHDLGLRDIVDLLLRVKAQAYSVEAATPRHSYEWRVWEEIRLPEGKILIPGVIAHTTAVVEHPETIAERILAFARVVGREVRSGRPVPAAASRRHVGQVRSSC